VYIERPGGKKEPLVLRVFRAPEWWGLIVHDGQGPGPFTAVCGEGGRPRTGRPFFISTGKAAGKKTGLSGQISSLLLRCRQAAASEALSVDLKRSFGRYILRW